MNILNSLSVRVLIALAIGLALGAAGGLGLTRFVASLLYDIRANDPATFAAASALLAMVALVASYVPARRALRVDAMATLKGE